MTHNLFSPNVPCRKPLNPSFILNAEHGYYPLHHRQTHSSSPQTDQTGIDSLKDKRHHAQFYRDQAKPNTKVLRTYLKHGFNAPTYPKTDGRLPQRRAAKADRHQRTPSSAQPWVRKPTRCFKKLFRSTLRHCNLWLMGHRRENGIEDSWENLERAKLQVSNTC